MNCKIKYFSDNAPELYKEASPNNDLEIPFKKYENDFAYDVVAISKKEVHPNVFEYGLGIGIQLDKIKFLCDLTTIIVGRENRDSDLWLAVYDYLLNNVVLSIDFRPRSSIKDTGLILSNCEGTIDEGYTNEIKAYFYHVIPDLPEYEIGDKIGQIKIGVTFKMNFSIVNEFKNTSRGLNGFGSTNK